MAIAGGSGTKNSKWDFRLLIIHVGSPIKRHSNALAFVTPLLIG